MEQVASRLGVRRELVEEYYMRSRYFVPRDGIRHMEREAEILGLPASSFLMFKPPNGFYKGLF